MTMDDGRHVFSIVRRPSSIVSTEENHDQPITLAPRRRERRDPRRVSTARPGLAAPPGTHPTEHRADAAWRSAAGLYRRDGMRGLCFWALHTRLLRRAAAEAAARVFRCLNTERRRGWSGQTPVPPDCAGLANRPDGATHELASHCLAGCAPDRVLVRQPARCRLCGAAGSRSGRAGSRRHAAQGALADLDSAGTAGSEACEQPTAATTPVSARLAPWAHAALAAVTICWPLREREPTI